MRIKKLNYYLRLNTSLFFTSGFSAAGLEVKVLK